jgi:hypothetical protein
MSAQSLERQLARMGLAGKVEGRGKLAILTLDDLHATRTAEVRAAALALAAKHGFTNLAVELADETGAALPRD